jgi:predicted DNA-binding protein (MmcQ/YjbR family)
MTIDEFNRFCAALPATTHVVQWGGSDVWKVGGKVFVIGYLEGDVPAFSFKVSPLAFEMMRDQPGLRPAPYLASRGLKWIQHFAAPGLSSTELARYLAESHRIVGRVLSRKTQRELGLLAEPASSVRGAAVTCDNPTC